MVIHKRGGGLVHVDICGQRGVGNTGRQGQKRKLSWFGHVVRMDNKILPAWALYCHVEGTRRIEGS